MAKIDITERRRELIRIALSHGWFMAKHYVRTRTQEFKRGMWTLTVDYAFMDVVTNILHPTKGITTMVRRKVTIQMFEEIARRPRVHTGKGHYIQSPMPRSSRKTA